MCTHRVLLLSSVLMLMESRARLGVPSWVCLPHSVGSPSSSSMPHCCSFQMKNPGWLAAGRERGGSRRCVSRERARGPQGPQEQQQVREHRSRYLGGREQEVRLQAEMLFVTELDPNHSAHHTLMLDDP